MGDVRPNEVGDKVGNRMENAGAEINARAEFDAGTSGVCGKGGFEGGVQKTTASLLCATNCNAPITRSRSHAAQIITFCTAFAYAYLSLSCCISLCTHARVSKLINDIIIILSLAIMLDSRFVAARPDV
jgi:hypothetical protein